MTLILPLLTILAIVVGPILAIEVQKLLEKRREALFRKLLIYKTLMATRGTILSPQHVEALNLIDIEFNSRDRKEKKVLDAWRVYRDHLGESRKGDDQPDNTEVKAWLDRRVELLTRLLSEMGQFLGYDFDEVQIRKGSYYPTLLGTVEDESHQIRSQFARVLRGEVSIPMKVTEFPLVVDDASVEVAVRKVMAERDSGMKALTEGEPNRSADQVELVRPKK